MTKRIETIKKAIKNLKAARIETTNNKPYIDLTFEERQTVDAIDYPLVKLSVELVALINTNRERESKEEMTIEDVIKIRTLIRQPNYTETQVELFGYYADIKEIAEYLNKSKSTIAAKVKKLVEEGKLKKMGREVQGFLYKVIA